MEQPRNNLIVKVGQGHFLLVGRTLPAVLFLL